MTPTPDVTRAALDFRGLAKEHFAFLTEAAFPQALVSEDPLAVGFEGHGFGFAVFHDRLSYELGISLWRPGESSEVDRPYSISDLMRVADPAAARRYRRFAATN